MATLKRGDKVKTIKEIKNGIFTANVREGAKGVVLSVNGSGTVAKVSFEGAGIGWPPVDCDVETKYLDKIR